MDLLQRIDMFVGYDVNEESDYQKFIKQKLAELGKSLGDMDDAETKEFFAMIEAEWTGEKD